MNKKMKKNRFDPAASSRVMVWWVLALLVLILCVSYLVTSQKKIRPGYDQAVAAFHRAATFIAEYKGRIKGRLSEVKQLTHNKTPTEEEIHFEFYSTLPNMTIPRPEIASGERQQKIPVSEHDENE